MVQGGKSHLSPHGSLAGTPGLLGLKSSPGIYLPPHLSVPQCSRLHNGDSSSPSGGDYGSKIKCSSSGQSVSDDRGKHCGDHVA